MGVGQTGGKKSGVPRHFHQRRLRHPCDAAVSVQAPTEPEVPPSYWHRRIYEGTLRQSIRSQIERYKRICPCDQRSRDIYRRPIFGLYPTAAVPERLFHGPESTGQDRTSSMKPGRVFPPASWESSPPIRLTAQGAQFSRRLQYVG